MNFWIALNWGAINTQLDYKYDMFYLKNLSNTLRKKPAKKFEIGKQVFQSKCCVSDVCKISPFLFTDQNWISSEKNIEESINQPEGFRRRRWSTSLHVLTFKLSSSAEEGFCLNIFTLPFFAALGNLANVLTKTGRQVEAERAFRKALELRPNMADVHYNL